MQPLIPSVLLDLIFKGFSGVSLRKYSQFQVFLLDMIFKGFWGVFSTKRFTDEQSSCVFLEVALGQKVFFQKLHGAEKSVFERLAGAKDLNIVVAR